MKPALLVIDIQKQFYSFDPETQRSLKEAERYINAAIALFHEKGLPVITIQHINERDDLVPGTEGFDLPDTLDILEGDTRVHKTYSDAFEKTDLKSKLDEMAVDTLILTGFCAEYCVLSTCRRAKSLDYTPIILRDALASPVAEHIKMVENINEVISLGALAKLLS